MKHVLHIITFALFVGCSQNASVNLPQESSSGGKGAAAQPMTKWAAEGSVTETAPIEAATPLRGVVWLRPPEMPRGTQSLSPREEFRSIFRSEIAAEIELSAEQKEQVRIAQEHRQAYSTRFKQAIESDYDADSDMLTKRANDLVKVDPELLRIATLRDAADHQIEQGLTAAQKEHLKQVVAEAPLKSELKSREVGLRKILDATPAVRALLIVGPFAGATVPWVISPDAKTLATPEQNTIKLWDLSTGRDRKSLGFALYPASWTNGKMAFGPTGKILAGGPKAGEMTVWDIASDDQQTILTGHSSWGGTDFQAIAISADGNTIASVGWAYEKLPPMRSVKLWSIADGRELFTLRGQSELQCVAFSPDGKLVAGGGGGPYPHPHGEIHVWDVASGQPSVSLEDAGDTITSLAFSPDGSTLASAGWNNEPVRIWDLATGKQRASTPKLQGNPYAPAVCAFSHDGKTLAVARKHEVLFWKVDGSQEPVVLRVGADGLGVEKYIMGVEGYISSLAFSTDGKTLATASPIGVILWDVATALKPGENVDKEKSPAVGQAN